MEKLMENEIYTISYFSKSALPSTGDELEGKIEDILTVSKRNNKLKNITGALLYSGGHFLQVLEGEKEAVDNTFEHIQRDSRHRDVTILSYDYQTNRSFPTWSMALAGVQKDLSPNVEGILSSPEDIEGSETGDIIISLLVRLLNGYENVKTKT
jgi:hypothetical protein